MLHMYIPKITKPVCRLDIYLQIVKAVYMTTTSNHQKRGVNAVKTRRNYWWKC